jgi:hypothetical protein
MARAGKESRFLHFFRHPWGDWYYRVDRNVRTLVGLTLKEVTYRRRKCPVCGAHQEEMVGHGDQRPIGKKWGWPQ